MNILFVCTGNTCRSPMAAAMMDKIASEQELDVRIESAGLFAEGGKMASDNAIRAAARNGIDLTFHRSQPVTESLIKQCDLILTMTEAHKKILEPIAGDKVYTLLEYAGLEGEIFDPYGGELDEYLACMEQLKNALAKVAERIKKND